MESEELQARIFTQNLGSQISSAKQGSDLFESFRHVKLAEKEESAVKRRGVEEQIAIRLAIDALLKNSLEQAKIQQELEKIYTLRHYESLKATKIAAWAGVVGAFLVVVSIVFQLQ